jgi:hypothetical protein
VASPQLAPPTSLHGVYMHAAHTHRKPGRVFTSPVSHKCPLPRPTCGTQPLSQGVPARASTPTARTSLCTPSQRGEAHELIAHRVGDVVRRDVHWGSAYPAKTPGQTEQLGCLTVTSHGARLGVSSTGVLSVMRLTHAVFVAVAVLISTRTYLLLAIWCLTTAFTCHHRQMITALHQCITGPPICN